MERTASGSAKGHVRLPQETVHRHVGKIRLHFLATVVRHKACTAPNEQGRKPWLRANRNSCLVPAWPRMQCTRQVYAALWNTATSALKRLRMGSSEPMLSASKKMPARMTCTPLVCI